MYRARVFFQTWIFRKTTAGILNLEMKPSDEMLQIATRVLPDMCTLVPEGAGELTTQGGLDIVKEEAAVRNGVSVIKEAGMAVSIFIDPDVVQVGRAKAVGADIVELHTGIYAEASEEDYVQRELEKIRVAAIAALEMGLRPHGGHGLTYRNIQPVAAMAEIEEVSIGHSIVARAVVVGMDLAVREMLALMDVAG